MEPKRLALRGAQDKLDAMNGALAAKQQQLGDIEAKVAGLQAQLEDTQAELASLQFQADLSAKRLARAEKLIHALGDESVRWKVGGLGPWLQVAGGMCEIHTPRPSA